MSDIEVKSFSEVMDDFKKLKPYDGVFIDNDGDIVFKLPTGSIYEIEKTRCNTFPKIIGWVMHMTEKNWVTIEAIRKFIYLAAETNGLGNPNIPC